MPTPEQLARATIDSLLHAAGWHVCDAIQTNIHAAQGVLIGDQWAGWPIGSCAACRRERGARIRRRLMVQTQERDTRKKRWEKLDDDFSVCVTGVAARYEPDLALCSMRHRTNNPTGISIV